MKYLYILFTLLTITTSLRAQIDFDKLDFIDIAEITTEQPISAIAQDESGMIWIATLGSGLYKFDGINYVSYSHNWKNGSSIGSNIIHTIFIDQSQRLWVGTDSGLTLYNKELDRFDKVKFNAAFDINDHFDITSIIEKKDGELYLGSYAYGLLQYKLDDSSISQAKLGTDINFSPPIITLVKDRKGKVFVGTNGGLMFLDEDRLTLEKCTALSKSFSPVSNTGIQTLIFDENNYLWIGTESGVLSKMTDENGNYHLDEFQFTKKKILSLVCVDQKILVGTENDGLYVIDTDGRVIKRYINNRFDEKSLRANSVWSLFLDHQNRIWFGHYNGGVSVHDTFHDKFGSIMSIENTVNSLQDPFTTGIQKDLAGRLWISLGGGLDIYDPSTGQIEHIYGGDNTTYTGLDDNLNIETMFIDSQQNIWLGTWQNGIYWLKNGTREFIHYNIERTQGALTSNSIRSFAEDSTGNIWIATFLKGLHYFNYEERTFFHCNTQPFSSSPLNTSDIQAVMVDSENNLWAGTSSGLFKIKRQGKGDFSITLMSDKYSKDIENHPNNNRILSLYESKDGQILIGTNGGGLLCFDKKKDEIYRYNDRLQFEETTVTSIIQDDNGTIWIGGKSGITKIDPSKDNAINFNTGDGLLSDYFNMGVVEKDNQGIIYFGSSYGINFIDPNKITFNDKDFFLYFTDFKLFNKTVELTDNNSPLTKVISQTKSLSLAHYQSVFTIEYNGISHTRPKKNQYAYMLEGFDSDWNYVGNTRSATYTNLKPGSYTFKVKAVNNDGIPIKQTLELDVEILPPWWRTNIAYVMYILLLSASVFAVTSFSRKRFKEKQAVLFEKEKRIQEEKLNEKKLQFFTNISHEFRTPLTLIINPINDLINKYDSQSPQVVEQKLKVIQKNSNRLSKLINELMDFRKLQSNKIILNVKNIDIIEHLKSTLDYFQEESLRRNIELRFITDLEELRVWVDPDMLEKIIFNILSNAFKVTSEEGKITIAIKESVKEVYHKIDKVTRTMDTVEISVQDTGPGIDQKDYKRIFKRFYQVSQLNKGHYGSSGIGLEMVKGLVEIHSGKIEVESSVGEGARFIVNLPLGKGHFSAEQVLNEASEQTYQEKEAHTQSISSEESVDISDQEANKDITVLIVEDNIELSDYLKSELEPYYTIITAPNGQKGWEIACEKSPDLIVTDIIMPVMDGLEMCEKIKGDIKTSHIPLLMLTAKAMVEDKIKGIDSGADAYLMKPFNLNVLKSTLKQLITSRQILFNKYHQNSEIEAPTGTTTIDNEFLRNILDYIHENIEKSDLSVELLAAQLFLSRSQLYRKIKGLTGLSANEFIRKIRLQKAKELLDSNRNYNVNEVAYKVGFASPSYFTRCFKKEFGYLPTKAN